MFGHRDNHRQYWNWRLYKIFALVFFALFNNGVTVQKHNTWSLLDFSSVKTNTKFFMLFVNVMHSNELSQTDIPNSFEKKTCADSSSVNISNRRNEENWHYFGVGMVHIVRISIISSHRMKLWQHKVLVHT